MWNAERKSSETCVPVPVGARAERGVALLEAAIVFPVLMILFAGMYDGFRAIQSYSALAEIAHESIRYGSRVPGLQPGTYCTACAAGLTPTPTPAHQAIHDRVIALQAAKSWYVPLGQLTIVTQLQDATSTNITAEIGGGNVLQDGVITMNLSGLYQGIFTAMFFRQQPVSVRVSAQYLG